MVSGVQGGRVGVGPSGSVTVEAAGRVVVVVWRGRKGVWGVVKEWVEGRRRRRENAWLEGRILYSSGWV